MASLVRLKVCFDSVLYIINYTTEAEKAAIFLPEFLSILLRLEISQLRVFSFPSHRRDLIRRIGRLFCSSLGLVLVVFFT